MNHHSFDDSIIPTTLIAHNTTASANSDWISPFTDNANRYYALLNAGAIGTSIDLKVTQAQDSSGTGAKDVTDADGNALAITQMVSADANELRGIDIGPGALDDKNGFKYIRFEVTIAGSCDYSLVGFKYDLRYSGVNSRTLATDYAGVRLYNTGETVANSA